MLAHVKETYRYVRAPVVYEDVDLNSSNCTEEKVEEALLAIKRNGVALKGNIRTRYNDMKTFSVNVQLR